MIRPMSLVPMNRGSNAEGPMLNHMPRPAPTPSTDFRKRPRHHSYVLARFDENATDPITEAILNSRCKTDRQTGHFLFSASRGLPHPFVLKYDASVMQRLPYVRRGVGK